jgi:predicted transcriptional regulator
MKRGRPTKKFEVQKIILEILSELNLPVNINSIQKEIYKRTKNKISWNTIQKYLKELVKLEKIEAVTLPHSKKEGKTGLTVYVLKR